ncbi:HD domain-containing protein [Pseudodesulfovibrio methanolicus]|uniref:HD domain-containing protein n=1 Tax=Pseudodesulfovibrio methanolicus TaxID=3126690 RepID=A0ABZ2IXG6_9BACT
MEEYFKKIDAKHRIRDPLYGFILLTDAELKIIDSPIFQRLRRIHQLALTKYVYPSAEHSRFVHSIGVMHCATLMLAGVMDHKHTQLNLEPSAKIIKTLRFAALLHDIGHLPFSHAVEKEWLQGLSHEDLSQYIINNYAGISDVITSENINPSVVAALLAKKPPAHYKLFHEIISGQLDADRADYLLRDSHSCGVKYGEYDFARYLQIFAAREEDATGHFSLVVDEADLHVAESFLVSRYHYNLQIPYHRTRSGYDWVLRRFVQEMPNVLPLTIENGAIVFADFERLATVDDYTIITAAKESQSEWSDYIFRNEHLVPVIDTTSSSSEGKFFFKALVRKLRDAPDFAEGEDYFTQEQPVEILKRGTEPDGSEAKAQNSPAEQYGKITLSTREGKGRPERYVDITDRSWIFRQLADEPVHIFRVYVKPARHSDANKLLMGLEAEERGAK